MKIAEFILGILGIIASPFIPSLSFVLSGIGLLMIGIDMSKGNKRTAQLVISIIGLVSGIIFRIVGTVI